MRGRTSSLKLAYVLIIGSCITELIGFRKQEMDQLYHNVTCKIRINVFVEKISFNGMPKSLATKKSKLYIMIRKGSRITNYATLILYAHTTTT